MKLIIEISENIYDTIMSDVMPDAGQMSAIITRIYQSKPYEERPHGEWIFDYTNGFGNKIGHCSECIYRCEHFNFCPNCGADMRVKDELNELEERKNEQMGNISL